jgi:hypothetical protein
VPSGSLSFSGPPSRMHLIHSAPRRPKLALLRRVSPSALPTTRAQHESRYFLPVDTTGKHSSERNFLGSMLVAQLWPRDPSRCYRDFCGSIHGQTPLRRDNPPFARHNKLRVVIAFGNDKRNATARGNAKVEIGDRIPVSGRSGAI